MTSPLLKGAGLTLPALWLFAAPAVVAPVDRSGVAARAGWQRLPSLPRPLGGHMAGVSGDALLVFGGTDFPVPLFQGGGKVWYDAVHALLPGATSWTRAGSLSHPLAYAGVVTLDDGVACIGGSDATQHHAEAFLLRWSAGRVERAPLPPLPVANALLGAAAIGRTLYAAGGQPAAESTEALRALWALDVSARTPRWQPVEPWPGPGRILPVVVAQDGALHVMSGAALVRGGDGTVVRRYLTDAYQLRPGRGWRRIADLPRPAVAAPALAHGRSHVLLLGGDDGANAARVRELGDRHPGFRRDVLAYDLVADSWTRAGVLPAGLVTTTAVPWNDAIVIPGGEDRPGHRVADVFVGRPGLSSTTLRGRGGAR